MPAARVLWCAGVTTVSSSELTTTRRTTTEKSSSPVTLPKSPEFKREEQQGWGPWSDWGACSHTCGAGRKTRSRQCLGKCQNHHLFENQERICVNPECNFL